MFLLDPAGQVISWNPAAERLLGYTPSEILQRGAAMLYPPEERAAGRPEAEMSAAAHAGALRTDGWRTRADGTRFWAEVSVSATRDHEGRLNGFVHILRDLTEQRRIEQLEAEGKRVIEFMAMLSHELRNPLAPIRNAVRILKRPSGQQQAEKYAEMIGRQVTQLTRLVDDLMDVSRIATGKIQLEKAPLEVNTLVQVAVESIRSTFETSGQTLEVRLAPQPVFIDGDSVRLTQVVVNLLSNAAKYTMPEGRVEISVMRNHAAVRIEVSDNGIGMSDSLMQHAFDPFVQGERSLDRSQGGLGMGLTVVKKIVDLHRGSVVVASGGQDKGTKFTIALPLSQEGAPTWRPSRPRPGPIPEPSSSSTTTAMPPKAWSSCFASRGAMLRWRSPARRHSTSPRPGRSPPSCSTSACPTCPATKSRAVCA
jgi:PAS domain S-box-containing protein